MSSSDTPYDPNVDPALDVDDDDWDDTLITPRARMPRNTKLLVALVVVAAAFAGGVFAQRHWGTTSSGTSAGAARTTGATGQASARGFGSAAGGTNRTGGGASAGFAGATIGQVAYLKGTTLYITDSSGNTVKVTVPKGTPVTKSVTTSLKGVRPGDTVVVRGSQGKNGTVTALSVSIGGSTGAGSFGGALGSGGATGFGGATTGSGGATGFGGSGG